MQRAVFAEYELSRMMMGTAQLGLQYGIANKLGQPTHEAARSMIAAAWEGGVNCLDTAAGYGASEEVVGLVLAELGIADKMIVVSKVIFMADNLAAREADAVVEESVTRSLRRLRLDVLPVCLFHGESNFLDYSESLVRLQERGLVGHIGASTDLPDGTAGVIRSGSAEAIQLPTSLLDHRFARRGLLREAAERGIALFARSVFLQGLLLLREEDVPAELAAVIPARRKLESLAREAGVTMAELAVRYLLGLDEITCLVMGAESVEQIRDNTRLISRGPLAPDLSRAVSDAVPDLPEMILFPRRWSTRMPDAKPVGPAPRPDVAED